MGWGGTFTVLAGGKGLLRSVLLGAVPLLPAIRKHTILKKIVLAFSIFSANSFLLKCEVLGWPIFEALLPKYIVFQQSILK